MLRSVTSKIVLVCCIALLPAFAAGGANYVVTQERDALAAALRDETSATTLRMEMGDTARDLVAVATSTNRPILDLQTEFADLSARMTELSTISSVAPPLSPAGEAPIIEDGAADAGPTDLNLTDNIAELAAAFNRMVETRASLTEQANTLDTSLIPAMQAANNALRAVAFDSASQELIATVSTIEGEGLRYELVYNKFRLTGSAETAEALSAQARSLRDAVRQARSTFRDVGREEAKAAFTEVRALEKATASFIDVRLASRELDEAMLNVHAPGIEAAIGAATSALEQQAAASARASEARAAKIEQMSSYSVIVSIFLAIIVLTVLTRMLSLRFRRTTTTIAALADGKTETEIDGVERKDEFGSIARALVVFKDNALKRSRAEQQASELRDTQERAAQESAEQDRILRHHVDDLVARVVAGDLAARITEKIDGGSRDRLVAGFNELVSVVDDTLGQTRGFARALAQGDLSTRFTGEFQGSFAELRDDLNTAGDELRAIVGAINGVASDITGASDAISDSARMLARQTETQAASLQETAATMEEMSASVKSNARSSGEASDRASSVAESALSGKEIATKAVAAIRTAADTSKKIAEITDLVDGIAFQTNLLALNAAVEAARAGEAGKGFAVVAAEVRELADRAGRASSDIKVLIDQSIAGVTNGVSLVESAGGSLMSIAEQVNSVEASIAGISVASAEQANGIGEIAGAISNLDGEVQSNATLASESAATADALRAYADKLKEAVGFFESPPSHGYGALQRAS